MEFFGAQSFFALSYIRQLDFFSKSECDETSCTSSASAFFGLVFFFFKLAAAYDIDWSSSLSIGGGGWQADHVVSESWKAHVPDSGGAVGLARFTFITTADVRGVDMGERCRSLRLLRASETELYLHRPRLVACELERLDGLLERIRRRQQRTHVNPPVRNEVYGPTEFHAGAKCATQLDFLGHHRVHRQCGLTAESYQHDCAQRARNLERSDERPRITRALE